MGSWGSSRACRSCQWKQCSTSHGLIGRVEGKLGLSSHSSSRRSHIHSVSHNVPKDRCEGDSCREGVGPAGCQPVVVHCLAHGLQGAVREGNACCSNWYPTRPPQQVRRFVTWRHHHMLDLCWQLLLHRAAYGLQDNRWSQPMKPCELTKISHPSYIMTLVIAW